MTDKPPFPYPDGYYDRETVIEHDGKTILVAGDPPLVEWMEAHGLINVTSIKAEPDRFTITQWKVDSDGIPLLSPNGKDFEEITKEIPR